MNVERFEQAVEVSMEAFGESLAANPRTRSENKVIYGRLFPQNTLYQSHIDGAGLPLDRCFQHGKAYFQCGLSTKDMLWSQFVSYDAGA